MDMQYLIDEARQRVMADVASRLDWREEVERGKMFGVALCETDAQDERVGNEEMFHGYVLLRAYSGQILGRSDWAGYVPAIYDYLQPDGYFKQHEAIITELNKRISAEQAKLQKGQRTREVEMMKEERKTRSQALQRWLFSQFVLTAADGEQRTVLEVFGDYAERNKSKQMVPPGGTGECCAPKLLQYANRHGMRVKALSEFWYGESPKGEVRHHGQYYEPCQAKCQPILWYMVPEGEEMEISGRRIEQGQMPTIHAEDIIYEDEWLIAINKPTHLLSVPGKRQLANAEDMLGDMLQTRGIQHPRAWRPKMVHRLDMDTSGVLIAAKDEATYRAMQRLFALLENVKKEYVAVLSCTDEQIAVLPKSGRVSLPLSSDFMNRPRQCVDYEHGKEAITEYEVIDREIHTILLHPLTGRTHQLRMHCAHHDALGMPILGDPLYGNAQAERMFLHARKVTFVHPVTRENIEIVAPIPPEGGWRSRS